MIPTKYMLQYGIVFLGDAEPELIFFLAHADVSGWAYLALVSNLFRGSEGNEGRSQ